MYELVAPSADAVGEILIIELERIFATEFVKELILVAELNDGVIVVATFVLVLDYFVFHRS